MVSVVVPVYNVEKYLKRCVDSILAQTEKQLEIILVDDGSTDSSGKLCDAYAKEHSHITVIHKENGGLTSAWIAGAKVAKGDYIGFVDSDDWIDPDMYQQMYEKAKEYNADMVCCGLKKEFENSDRSPSYLIDRLQQEFYNRKEIAEKIVPVFLCDGSFDSRAIPASRAMKLYRRELISNNIKYCRDEVSIGEDLVITFACFQDCESICAIHDFYPYHYWINESSLTGKHDREYLKKLLILRKQLLYINKAKGGYDYSQQIVNDFLFLVLMCIKEEIHKNHSDTPKEVVRRVKDICETKEVAEALQTYQMPKLMLTGKVFVFFMKHKLYWFMYLAIKAVFR